MQVSDLLTLMGTLSVGSDNVPPSERIIFLRYLNLAHFELYQETAALNDDLLVQEKLSNVADSNKIALSKVPYVMHSVFDITHQQALKRKSIKDILERDPLQSATGYPTHYFLKQNILEFYPTQQAVTPISVWYTPSPSLLAEDTGEQFIPYPPAYHPVLADGALYYLFQQEGGFKNAQKENEARERWLTGKTRLFAYLFNTGGGSSISTFSNV